MTSHEFTITDILSQGTYGFIVFGIVVLSFILAVLWVILPFAIFRIKSLVEDIRIQLAHTNNSLKIIEGLLKDQLELNNKKFKLLEADRKKETVKVNTPLNDLSNISDTVIEEDIDEDH